MDGAWEAYFALLEKLGRTLEQLGEIEKSKTAAVRRADLMELDACMKREQAVGMGLRALEQKRGELRQALGIPADAPLSALPEHCPPELRPRARQASEALLARCGLYRSAADTARFALEYGLHQVETILKTHYGDYGDFSGGILPGGRSGFADIRA